MRGGFDSIEQVASLHNLTYIKLSTSSDFGKVVNIKGNMNEIIAEAERGIRTLIDFYNNKSIVFRVQTDANMYDLYTHLARTKELV